MNTGSHALRPHIHRQCVCVCVCITAYALSVYVCVCMCARVTASTLVESIMNPKAKYCILHVHVCINTVHGQCTRT